MCNCFFSCQTGFSAPIDLHRKVSSRIIQCPMDATASGTSPVIQFHNIADEPTSHSSPLHTVLERSQRHCYGNGTPGEFPLAVSPSIVLHVLSACELGPKDLAALEASHTATLLCFNGLIDAAIDELARRVRLHVHSSVNLRILHQTLRCHFQSLPRLICARKDPCLS